MAFSHIVSAITPLPCLSVLPFPPPPPSHFSISLPLQLCPNITPSRAPVSHVTHAMTPFHLPGICSYFMLSTYIYRFRFTNKRKHESNQSKGREQLIIGYLPPMNTFTTEPPYVRLREHHRRRGGKIV